MMPLEESVKGNLFAKNENTGEIIELETSMDNFKSAIKDVTIAAINVSKEIIKAFNNISMSINFNVKYISKKRFKKLLMSKGYQRNEAEQICNRIWFKQQCYKEIDLINF